MTVRFTRVVSAQSDHHMVFGGHGTFSAEIAEPRVIVDAICTFAYRLQI
jgi:hypothetical protein